MSAQNVMCTQMSPTSVVLWNTPWLAYYRSPLWRCLPIEVHFGQNAGGAPEFGQGIVSRSNNLAGTLATSYGPEEQAFSMLLCLLYNSGVPFAPAPDHFNLCILLLVYLSLCLAARACVRSTRQSCVLNSCIYASRGRL